jgi:hypothetical protein
MDLETRIAALEDRVRELEDELALHRVMTSYGPAVDTGDSRAASRLWVEDGVYDADGPGALVGRSAIEGMLDGDHQSLVPGCAHINGPAIVRVDGDRATAVGYSRVYETTDGRHRMFRLAANRWEFVRTADGWLVERRINRVLGSEASLDVLRSALA